MDCSDGSLIFYEPVASLQNISAFRLALELWTFKELRGGLSGNVSDNPRLPVEELREIIKDYHVPDKIIQIIDNFIQSVSIQYKTWWDHHRKCSVFSCSKRKISAKKRQEILPGNEINSRVNLHMLVWRQDATIDYEETALKLVKNGGLNLYHKFDLFCEYFMEDELRNAREMWFEMQDKNSRIYIGKTQVASKTVTYWNSIISQELPIYYIGSDVQYLVNRATGSAEKRNFSSVKFTLDRIQADNRIPYMIQLLQNRGRFSSQSQGLDYLIKFMISKYSESEQYKLLITSNLFIDFMEIFSMSEANVECTLQTWLHVRNLINGHQFVSMLRQIGEKRSRLTGNCTHELLVELWRSSPISLKKFVNDDFLDEFCIRPPYIKTAYQFLQRNDQILIEILSDAEPDFRRNLWRRYWAQIIDRSQPANLKTIMGLCVSESAIIDFKSEALSSGIIMRYFSDLIVNGMYSMLNEFLELLVGGEKEKIFEYERRVLESTPDSTRIMKKCEETDEFVDALSNFLAEVFEEHPDRLIRFKVNMISSRLISHRLEYTNNNMVRIFCVSERLCDDQTLALVKEEILRRCGEAQHNQQLKNISHQPRLAMVLLWCLGGSGKRVDEFIKLQT